MGHLRGGLKSLNMLASWLLAVLALSSTCHGAALDRARREAIAGKLDRSFDMFGVHVGLKYKDPSDRLKGGELRVAIDDMKALFPRAHSRRTKFNLKYVNPTKGRDLEIDVN